MIFFKKTITRGRVFEKKFIPAHFGSYTNLSLFPVGKIVVPFKQTRLYATKDAWVVRIESIDKKGRKSTADYFVSKECYDSIQIGDEYTYDPKRDSKYIPYS